MELVVGWLVSQLVRQIASWACIKGVTWTAVGARSKAGELCFNKCYASSGSFFRLPSPLHHSVAPPTLASCIFISHLAVQLTFVFFSQGCFILPLHCVFCLFVCYQVSVNCIVSVTLVKPRATNSSFRNGRRSACSFQSYTALTAQTTKPEILTPLKAENSHPIKSKCAMPVVAARSGRYCACSAHLQSRQHDLVKINVRMILFISV